MGKNIPFISQLIRKSRRLLKVGVFISVGVSMLEFSAKVTEEKPFKEKRK